jgi:hypothetical protein
LGGFNKQIPKKTKASNTSTKHMTRIKILLLGWAIAMSFTACYKSGGELIITDDPPVVEVDTTVIEYATNFKVGDIAIPADTVFALATIQPGSSIFYNLDFEVAGMLTCSILWLSTQNQPQLVEGSYQGGLALMLNNNSISLVEDWILDGMNINNYPFVEIIGFSADAIEIALSDVEEDIRRDTLPTGEVMVVDRAKVTLSGSLIDSTGQFQVVSGDFTCNFSRPE